jgi:hypothetical protein
MGIIVLKERTYIPKRNASEVITLFYFATDTDFLNIFFMKPNLLRMNTPCKLAILTDQQHQQLLSSWSSTVHVDNTIYDSMLPFPNTKNYVWKNPEVNKVIQEFRSNHQSLGRHISKNRPCFTPEHKKMMSEVLYNCAHYVIEIRQDSFDDFITSSNIHIGYSFEIKPVNSGVINNTNYVEPRINYNIFDAIKVFSNEFSVIPEQGKVFLKIVTYISNAFYTRAHTIFIYKRKHLSSHVLKKT